MLLPAFTFLASQLELIEIWVQALLRPESPCPSKSIAFLESNLNSESTGQCPPSSGLAPSLVTQQSMDMPVHRADQVVEHMLCLHLVKVKGNHMLAVPDHSHTLSHSCLPHLPLETMSYSLHPDFLSWGLTFQM